MKFTISVMLKPNLHPTNANLLRCLSNDSSLMRLCRTTATKLAALTCFNSSRELWEKNKDFWNLPLSKKQKLKIGSYIILRDFGEGLFPPTFDDQQKAYNAEINYRFNLPGTSPATASTADLRKPFWDGPAMRRYMANFMDLTCALERCHVHPPQRLLELGCGVGWMAEFLALMGFSVLGTSISPHDIMDAEKRLESLRLKGLSVDLKFRKTPMESVAEATRDLEPFDATFVFEALHHAFDWSKAIDSAFECLKPGGWLLICNEPNWIHTFSSYRVARLSNTHEVGFLRRDLMDHLKQKGFKDVSILKNSLHFRVRPHWIAAKK